MDIRYKYFKMRRGGDGRFVAPLASPITAAVRNPIR